MRSFASNFFFILPPRHTEAWDSLTGPRVLRWRPPEQLDRSSNWECNKLESTILLLSRIKRNRNITASTQNGVTHPSTPTKMNRRGFIFLFFAKCARVKKKRIVTQRKVNRGSFFVIHYICCSNIYDGGSPNFKVERIK